MNQIELSKKLGKSQSYVSKYLRGERGCSLKTARKLTELFGCNPLFWLEATPEQKAAIICPRKSDRRRRERRKAERRKNRDRRQQKGLSHE